MTKTKHNIVTKFGTVEVMPTSGDHIYVCELDRVFLNVNGTNIHIGVHFYLWNNGVWHVGPQFNKEGQTLSSYERSCYFFASRPSSVKDVTDSARKKLTEELCEAVNGWARNHTSVIIEADVDDMTNRMAKLTVEIASLTNEAAQKMEQRNGIKALRDAKEKALANPMLEKV